MKPKRLTDDELAAIAARAEAATPGPWQVVPRCTERDWDIEGPEEAYYRGQFARRTDAEFIAHARADIPALLAHIRAQDAATARLRDALRDVCAAAEYVDPYEEGMDQCLLCNCWREDGHFKHDDDCPVGAARALLDGGLDTLGPARVRMNMRAAGPLPPSEPREWDWLDDDTDGSKGGSGDDAP